MFRHFGVFAIKSDATSYTFTLKASDIANNYVTTPSGNKISFESNNVTAEDGKIIFAKNGYLRFTDPINGSTSASIITTSFSNDDKLMLQSGYQYNDYGAANYFTKDITNISTYYRTYFQLLSDTSQVSIDSLTLNYACDVHYNFVPIMDTVTDNVGYGSPSDVYTYSGLSYQNDIGPDLNEVDVVTERFTLDLSTATTPDPIYSIHPVAKFYDKGGCLIKQVEGFWLCHVNPIIRFFTAKDKFESYAFTYGDSFDLDPNTSPLYEGYLSGFDWSDYTADDGVLTKPLTTSMDLYPKVRVNINPGAYSDTEYSTITFTPNAGLENYGFPNVAAPEIKPGYEVFNFAGWFNGEELYDPLTASDFHDYDLYAEYNSDYDLRIKFQNRGFNNPYLEIGVPNHETRQMPGTDTYKDQSTIGVAMGPWFKYNDETSKYTLESEGYFVYPEGRREEGRFYAVGEDFTNDNIGTSANPAVYIAEPYLKHSPTQSFEYLQFFNTETGFGPSGLIIGNIQKHFEHMYYDGINDIRTYFKKIVLPDSVPFSSPMMPNFTPYGVRGTDSCDWDDTYFGREDEGIGITDSKELEVIVGNDHFCRTFGGSSSKGYGFKNNAELRRLEYFPNLTDIAKYSFWHCPKLEPMQNWVDIGPIDQINEHAFDSCFVNPITDASGNISRRRFELPDTLMVLRDYVFAKAVYTDFVIDGDGLTALDINSFAYSDDSSHSADFLTMKQKYESGTADVAALKAVANHVYFNGTQSQFESLIGEQYNELNILLDKEYYVTFSD